MSLGKKPDQYPARKKIDTIKSDGTLAFVFFVTSSAIYMMTNTAVRDVTNVHCIL